MRLGLATMLLLATLGARGLGAAVDANDASRQTVSAVRDAGTLLVSWVLDHSDAAASAQSAGSEPHTRWTWSACPSIPYEEARGLVDPRFAERFPRVDGWGHELQFCLRREDLTAPRYVVGIRSPGRDGHFEGDTYSDGEFPADQLDRDVVWLDGVFVAWPGSGR